MFRYSRVKPFPNALTWCPEQMEPLGTRTRKGLCTGQEVRGPQRVAAACCSDSAELHGLKSAGGGGMLMELRPLKLRQ